MHRHRRIASAVAAAALTGLAASACATGTTDRDALDSAAPHGALDRVAGDPTDPATRWPDQYAYSFVDSGTLHVAFAGRAPADARTDPPVGLPVEIIENVGFSASDLGHDVADVSSRITAVVPAGTGFEVTADPLAGVIEVTLMGGYEPPADVLAAAGFSEERSMTGEATGLPVTVALVDWVAGTAG